MQRSAGWRRLARQPPTSGNRAPLLNPPRQTEQRAEILERDRPARKLAPRPATEKDCRKVVVRLDRRQRQSPRARVSLDRGWCRCVLELATEASIDREAIAREPDVLCRKVKETRGG